MIRSAPASRAPATAPRPTSPAPKTAHVDPASTLAMYSAAPRPVVAPQASVQEDVERRLGVDLRQRDLRHHRRLGERAGAHEVPDALAVSMQAGRAVGEVALVLLLADREGRGSSSVKTQWMHSPHCGLNRVIYVVARREGRDAVTDRLDDARALMAEDGRGVTGGVDAAGGVEVGMADPAGGQAARAPRRFRARRGPPLRRRAAGRTPPVRRLGCASAKRTRSPVSARNQPHHSTCGSCCVRLGSALRVGFPPIEESQ